MWVPLIRMCCRMGNTRVSWWRWWIGVELVQPVAIRSAEFCVVCSLSMRVLAVLGSQEGCAYERMGLMYCLYTWVMSSLEWPKDVFGSARRTFRRVFAFVFMLGLVTFFMLLQVFQMSFRRFTVSLNFYASFHLPSNFFNFLHSIKPVSNEVTF